MVCIVCNTLIYQLCKGSQSPPRTVAHDDDDDDYTIYSVEQFNIKCIKNSVYVSQEISAGKQTSVICFIQCGPCHCMTVKLFLWCVQKVTLHMY